MALFSHFYSAESFGLDEVADAVSAPLFARLSRFGGEEDEEPDEDSVSDGEDEDEDEDDVEPDGAVEEEDDFEEVSANGTPVPVSAAEKAAKKAKAAAKKKPKKKKKKKTLTCEQIRSKVHTCVSRMWGYTVGSADRLKWQKKANGYKKRMADKGCKDIPL